eukprot:1977687-Rhodomonas_salina.2
MLTRSALLIPYPAPTRCPVLTQSILLPADAVLQWEFRYWSSVSYYLLTRFYEAPGTDLVCRTTCLRRCYVSSGPEVAYLTTRTRWRSWAEATGATQLLQGSILPIALCDSYGISRTGVGCDSTSDGRTRFLVLMWDITLPGWRSLPRSTAVPSVPFPLLPVIAA